MWREALDFRNFLQRLLAAQNISTLILSQPDQQGPINRIGRIGHWDRIFRFGGKRASRQVSENAQKNADVPCLLQWWQAALPASGNSTQMRPCHSTRNACMVWDYQHFVLRIMPAMSHPLCWFCLHHDSIVFGCCLMMTMARTLAIAFAAINLSEPWHVPDRTPLIPVFDAVPAPPQVHSKTAWRTMSKT
jgi:hypothetical protein